VLLHNMVEYRYWWRTITGNLVEGSRLMSDDTNRAVPDHKPEDIPVYMAGVIFIGVIACLAVGGAVALAILGKPIPDILVAVGSAAVGALAGLLAPSPKQ